MCVGLNITIKIGSKLDRLHHIGRLLYEVLGEFAIMFKAKLYSNNVCNKSLDIDGVFLCQGTFSFQKID